jgi:KRAB domain-containing zinc finger protein
MHTSQRGRRRKVTKYWEMENQEISEVSDFQRDSDMNSDDDDMTIASDDDWSVNGRDDQMKDDLSAETDGDQFFHFELQPYHIVLSLLGRKVFQCDICSGIYRHSFSLKRHYIRNHVNHVFVSTTDLLHCNITINKTVEKVEVEEEEEREEDEKRSEEDENVSNDAEEEAEKNAELENVENNSESDGEAKPDREDTEEKKSENVPAAPIVEEAPQSNDSEDGKIENENEQSCDDARPMAKSPEHNGEEKPADASSETKEEPKKDDEKADDSKEGSPEIDQNSNSSSEVNSNQSEQEGIKPPQRMTGLYRCNVCEKLFDCIPDLKTHLTNHPESSSKAYACDKCNMKFSHKPNLMRHAAVHTGKCTCPAPLHQSTACSLLFPVLGSKPFICNSCGKKFSTLTNLRRHERIHQGRRLPCQQCSSTFSQTGDLKKHVKKFHPDSFHDCPVCAKYYLTAEELVVHVDQVHGEKDEASNETGNHDCKYCGKHSVTATSKRRHERVHLGVRVQCQHCRSSFSQSPALKKHIKKMHPERFHECSSCGKYFGSGMSLAEHTAKNHTENSNSALISCYAVDTESDKAESMRLAYQRSATCSKPSMKYACTVCRKQFHDYSNMCRHRSMAHHQQILQLSSLKKHENSSPLRSLFDPDMERNSAFYAKVAKNIADNLRFNLEGTQDSLNQCGNLIRRHQEQPVEAEEGSVQKKEDSLERYNFPNGFTLLEKEEVYGESVSMDDYMEKSGLIEAEKQRSIVSPSKEPRDEVESIVSEDNSHSVGSPNGSIELRVPSMKLCRLCHEVFHSEAIYQDHLQRQHGAPTQSPPPAHQHPQPLQLLTPRWLPGMNPNHIPSLVIPPNAVPPPAHQKGFVLSPPQLCPIPKSPPVSLMPVRERTPEKREEEEEVDKSKLITGEDPNPAPKKHICLICFDEFPAAEALSSHQTDRHATVQCKGLVVDLSFSATWYTRPTAVGMLNISSNQIPTEGNFLTPNNSIPY